MATFFHCQQELHLMMLTEVYRSSHHLVYANEKLHVLILWTTREMLCTVFMLSPRFSNILRTPASFLQTSQGSLPSCLCFVLKNPAASSTRHNKIRGWWLQSRRMRCPRQMARRGCHQWCCTESWGCSLQKLQQWKCWQLCQRIQWSVQAGVEWVHYAGCPVECWRSLLCHQYTPEPVLFSRRDHIKTETIKML